MTNGECAHCGKECPPNGGSFCSWDCHILAAAWLGGKKHVPNDLPITCIKYDGSMYEHEHGDHPDYVFPVKVEYVGDDAEEQFSCIGADGEKADMGPGWIESQRIETHALIYTDGTIAVTMYECCYAMWSVDRSGELIGGSMWKQKDWKLTDDSIQKIFSLKKTNEM